MMALYDASGQLVADLPAPTDTISIDYGADTDRLEAVLADLVSEEVALRMALESGGKTVAIGSGWGAAEDLETASREDMIRAARKAFYKNPIGRNAINALRLFVCGGGFTVRPIDQDLDTQEFLEEFNEQNSMVHLVSELAWRTFRDGEVYLREIPADDGMTLLRWLDPLRICPSFDTDDPRPFELASTTGVVTDPDDIQKVLHYTYDTTGNSRGNLRIPAKEVHHVKYGADSDMLHGRPLLEPVFVRLGQYEQWVTQRAIINRLKTAVYLIRKVRGTAGAVSAAVDKTIMSSRSGRTGMAKLPPPGIMLTATDNIDYQFTEPKLDARDVAEDGRRIVLDVAAGLGMPLPLLTGDVSETTYAGLLVAESPFVRRAQSEQNFFGVALKRIYRNAIKRAIAEDRLPPTSHVTRLTPEAQTELEHWEADLRDAAGDGRRSARARSNIAQLKARRTSYTREETPRKTRVQIVWPEVIHRDFKALVEGLEILDRIAIASKSTMAALADLDYEEERRRMVAERSPDSDLELDRLDDEIGAGADIGEEQTEEEDEGAET